MDTESHRPPNEPENREIHRDFPADAAQEKKGLRGSEEVPENELGAPTEHRRERPGAPERPG